jgi:hypothetical protein
MALLLFPLQPLGGSMASKYTTPEAITVEWVGPFNLDQAADHCEREQLVQGLYIAFGREKSGGWWPYYWETRWVGQSSRLSNRLARMPLQYIGISGELCGRVNLTKHEKLGLLDPSRTDLWLANPISYLDYEKKNGLGHQLAIAALEKALIFSLKPRLNVDETASTSAPLCVGWCLPNRVQVKTRNHQTQLHRLPALIRFDPGGKASVEYLGSKKPTARFRVKDFCWHPALPARQAFPNFVRRQIARIGRMFALIGSTYQSDNDLRGDVASMPLDCPAESQTVAKSLS